VFIKLGCSESRHNIPHNSCGQHKHETLSCSNNKDGEAKPTPSTGAWLRTRQLHDFEFMKILPRKLDLWEKGRSTRRWSRWTCYLNSTLYKQMHQFWNYSLEQYSHRPVFFDSNTPIPPTCKYRACLKKRSMLLNVIYLFIHNLLNVLVQFANKMGFKRKNL
jgi:hypothetical protein